MGKYKCMLHILVLFSILIVSVSFGAGISISPGELKFDNLHVDEESSKNITIENNLDHAIEINSSDFEKDLEDFEDITVSITPNSLKLDPGTEGEFTIIVNVGEDADEGIYFGEVSLEKDSSVDSFDVEVWVNPEICEAGADENLRLDADLGDLEDKYYPGDEIKLDNIELKNVGDDEITDIIVEMTIYDMTDGDEVTSVESEEINLDEDEDTELSLNLTVPDDIDEEHVYYLIVKAYEDGNEDENCVYEIEKDLNLERRSRDMLITLKSIKPETANCGDYVEFAVEVKNTGKKDDSSVYVEVHESQYKFEGRTAEFSLDSDEKATKTIKIKLPEEIDSRTYYVEANVRFDNGNKVKSDFGSLTINCAPKNQPPVANAGQDLEVEAGQVVTLDGSASSDPDNDQLTYEWKLKAGLAVQLSNPHSAVTTFTPEHAGTYVFKLTVSDGEFTSSDTITITVKETTTAATGGTVKYEPTSRWDKLSTETLQKIAWIVGIIVMLMIAVYFGKLAFSPRRPLPPELPKPYPEEK